MREIEFTHRPLHAWDSDRIPANEISEVEKEINSLFKDLLKYREDHEESLEERKEYKSRVSKFVLKVLECLDYFVELYESLNMLDEGADNLTFRSNFEAGVSQIERALEKLGVSEIVTTPGQTFDPSIHKKVMEESTTDVPSGTIGRILQKGYAYEGKCIRKTCVNIAK